MGHASQYRTVTQMDAYRAQTLQDQCKLKADQR